ncbi:MAG: hypothetical protein JW765_11915, partial [Deltaproteobacteria bacterium]|nr:hypothetical protein [Candidatus Zymogenaceae bacterium]
MVKKVTAAVGWLVGSVLLVCSGAALAQTSGDSERGYPLGEIVVSAEKSGVEAVATVREITAKDIQ